MVFWLTSGTILFSPVILPPNWVSILKFHEIPKWFEWVIGVVFVFATSLLLVRLFIYSKTKINIIERKRNRKKVYNRLVILIDEYQSGLKKPSDYIKWAYRVKPLIEIDYGKYCEFSQNCKMLAKWHSKNDKRMFEYTKNNLSNELRRIISEIEGEIGK